MDKAGVPTAEIAIGSAVLLSPAGSPPVLAVVITSTSTYACDLALLLSSSSIYAHSTV